jgi:hypothetical protein
MLKCCKQDKSRDPSTLSVEKKKPGHEPQGAWHQDELFGGKQPVIK